MPIKKVIAVLAAAAAAAVAIVAGTPTRSPPADHGTLTIASTAADGGPQTAIALLGNGIGAPVVHAPPAVTGTPDPGATLTTTPGGWGGGAPMTYSYQWLRCAPTGTKCLPIANATGTSYKVTAKDLGYLLAMSVTAHNDAGDGGPGIGYADAAVSLEGH
jgi:hypothetical protein